MQKQKFNWFIVLFLLPTLIWGLFGCGGQSESAPPAEATVAATAPAESETGPAENEEVAATPQTSTAETTQSTEVALVSPEPATVQEAIRVINLLELPRLEEAQLGNQEPTYLTYETSADLTEAIDFYLAELAGLGWQEETANKYVGDDYAQFAFTKEGFYLSLSLMNSIHGKEGIIDVSLRNQGNFDVRTLPRFPEAETIGGDIQTSAIYFTPAKVADVVEFSRQELAALGWQEYTRPDTTYADDPDHQSLSLKKNGVDLSVSIDVAPAQGGKTGVQYSAILLSHDWPTLADAENIELDDYQLYLSYTTASDVETALDFYRSELEALDWEENVEAGAIDSDKASLSFQAEEGVLLLDVGPDEAGETRVTLAGVSAEALAALEATVTPPAETNSLPTEEPQGSDSALSVQDIPMPEDAQEVSFDAEAEQVTYTSASTIDTLVQFYRQELTAQGWVEDETFSTIEENIALFGFEQGEATLFLNIFNIGLEGSESEVTITPTGLAWDDTSVAGDSSITSIPAVPLPLDAQEVAYDADFEEVSFTSASDMETIIEFYSQALSAQGWQTLETITTDYSGQINFIKDEASFMVYLSNFGPGETEVTLSGTGVSLWETTAGATDTTEVDEDTVETGEDTPLTAQFLENGLPIPDNNSGYSSEGSPFRNSTSASSPSDLTAVLEFYRRELAALGWQEQTDAAVVEDSQATLKFEGQEGLLVLELNGTTDGTEIVLATKNAAAAEEAGLLPEAGKARLTLANINEAEVVVTIDGQEIKVGAGVGVDQPDGPMLDLEPGVYPYTLSIPGEETINDELEVGADEVWGLMIGPGGAFPVQVY